ncbi:ATP-dependent DNA ligase [Durotheca rogersii]|uniref:ATP-dependent DNA ligase n=1 Tax=Durotheca rogersii TaxID=419775 RepID=UPI0022206282|nr:ATP-dependent DNA ligase [Durotheca rogersii]KAI5863665.1 ATP-dependent DNA ligase [Durotheca rogersii]
MSSPAKKRKLNSAQPSRGLEYFFSKQKQKDGGGLKSEKGPEPSSVALEDRGMTDEELARKLQAEWDREAEIAGRDSISLTSKPIVTDTHDSENSRGAVGIQKQALPPLMAAQTEPASKGKNTLSLQSVATSADGVSDSVPFDESPLTFDPAQYIPQLREHWERDGGDASYALLTRCFVLINGTSSRIKIVDTLVNCLRVLIEGDPESLLPAVWLATNSISPSYESLELGLGASAISKALKNVCGLDARSLKAIYDKHGDAGDVAFEAKKKQSFTLRRPKPLTIKGVYKSLVKVAGSQGPGSSEAKQRIVDRLLQDACGGEESRYVVRTLCQHLRIGAVKTTMLIALSRAFLLSRPPGADFPLKSVDELRALKKEELAAVWGRAEEIVKACFARRPNYNDLVPAMLEIGVCDELLVRCALLLHVPLRPMLGSITRDLSEMLTRLWGRDFACEFKYDGQRAQVHCDERGRVSLFSRHLELMTDKYPDLVEIVPRIRGGGVDSFVMEGEVVAVDRRTGELRNFQTLTGRARKDVSLGTITVDVCLFAFDLMYLNGQPLLDRPFRERRSLLRSLFTEVPHRFTWVRSLDATSQDSEAVLDFFKQATDSKCEGIMVKILDNLPDSLDTPVAGTEVGDDPERGDGSSKPLALPKPKGKKSKVKAKAKEPATAITTTTDTTSTSGGENNKLPSTPPPPSSSRRKALLATYEPDKRLDSWLKVKKDYDSSAFETLDLVPVAAWHGQGRKARWWSPILMAVRDDATGELQVVCKCISGFTDAFYKANREFYDDSRLLSPSPAPPSGSEEGEDEGGPEGNTDGADRDGNRINVRRAKPGFVGYAGPEPDVWFEPQEVWEMAFADVTLSPIYTAALGLVSLDRGLSLRFPRFLRKREDKSIEEASTSEFLAALYRKQEARAPPPPLADGSRAVEEEADERDDE